MANDTFRGPKPQHLGNPSNRQTHQPQRFTTDYQIGINLKVVGKCDPQTLSHKGAWTPQPLTLPQLADHISAGHPWMPSSLDGNGKRWQTNANYAEVLGLDIDEGITIQDAIAHPFIAAHCGLLIESASSSPEHHKFRLVFPLSQPVKGWEKIRLCNRYLAQQVGSADPACKDASRFFFGAPGRQPHLLQDVTLPPSFVEDAIAWGEALEAEERKRAEIAQQQYQDLKDSGADTDALLLAALKTIPPDCDYSEWLGIGMALAGMGDQWFPAWNQWSAGASSYKASEMAGRWKSFRGKEASPGVIFGIAKRHGWHLPSKGSNDTPAAVKPRRQPPQPEQPTPPAGDADDLPKLAKRFRAVERIWARSLRFNQLTNAIELNGEPVEDVSDLRLTLALDYGLSVSVADCEAIVKRLANNNTYHPVAEYLDSCAQTYGNSTAILDNLAPELFGSQIPIHNVFLKKTLVGAVARIEQPGCKVDTALFLQGHQGFNKSSFFKALVGATWFDDTMGSATSERDERLKLHQFWVLEWAELENVFKKRDISAVKAFLSCGVDTVRPPYGRNAVSLKRRSVIVGSTNQTEFLTDTTGNRRFWVVSVQKRIDLKQVAQLRDRIWAAAVALYRSGYQWWLSDDEEAIAAEFNESYRTEDPWVAAVGSYLRNNNLRECTSTELLKHALDIPPGQQNKGHQNRLGEVLRDLGWEPTRLTRGDKRPRGWRAPEPDPSPQTEDALVWKSAEIQVQQGFEPDTHNGVIHPPSEDGSGDGQAETKVQQGFEKGDPSRSIRNGQKTQKNNSDNDDGHSSPGEFVPITDQELQTLLEVNGHAG